MPASLPKELENEIKACCAMSEIMVSICMITYNHEPFIREAIEGVLMQQSTFPYELVIGEDYSTDRTRDICIEYQQKHPDKIRLLLNEKNLGVMPNFIQTLNACSSKYIALCEGEDYWTDPLKPQEIGRLSQKKTDVNF